MPSSTVLEQRVTRLEDIMAELAYNVNQLTANVNSLHEEMREFKDEMREFKEEMREFKDEMRSFKDESNKKWGELSNKMGTMAEDLVAPSIGRILRETIGCPDDQIEWQAIRVRVRSLETGQRQEFDVVVVCGDYLLINETKSRLNPEDLPKFVELLKSSRNYFPQYASKKVIGAIASLYVDESLVRRGERLGLIVLGTGDHLMQVLNSPDFSPQPF